MEIGKTTVSVKEGEEAHIYLLGDIHWGSANCQHRALNRAISIIQNDPKAHYFLMGDLINCIVPSDMKRFSPVEADREAKIRDLKDLPNIEVRAVLERFAPIADRCLAILCGNHEGEYIKRHSSDVYDREAAGFPKAIKLGGVGIYRVTLDLTNASPSIGFDFALNHGSTGGGKMFGYPENKARETFEWFSADFNVMGHVHRLSAKPGTVIRANQYATGIVKERIWYGISGGFKTTYEPGNADWFESKGRQEADVGLLKATISVGRDTRDGRRQYRKFTDLKTIYLD